MSERAKDRIGSVLIDTSVLLIFFLMCARHFIRSLNMVVVGMDVPSHLLNALKIAQSGCSWSDTLLLYNHIHFIHHHLQFHYPPLAYLSSYLTCAFGIDIRLAVALANIVWLFLGYLSIAAAAATAAENRLASLCAALIAGMVLMSPIVNYFLNDPGWRVAAFGFVGFAIWAFLGLAEHHERFWSWLVMGMVLGAGLLIHVLVFMVCGLVLLAVVAGSTELRASAFARLRLLWTVLGALFVASLFYLPLAMFSLSEFAREWRGEALISKPKLASEFANIVRSYSHFMPATPATNARWATAATLSIPVVLIGGLAFGGRRVRLLVIAYALSHAILVIGRTPGHESYMMPIVSLGLLAVATGFCSVLERMRFLKPLLAALLIPFVAALHTPSLSSPTENGTDWEPDMIARAIGDYSHLAQDEFCVIECTPHNLYRDRAAIAVAFTRPDESTELLPFIYNSVEPWMPRRAMIGSLERMAKEKRCELILLFKPLAKGSPCSILELEEYSRLMNGYRFVRGCRLRLAWMEIYERKRLCSEGVRIK